MRFVLFLTGSHYSKMFNIISTSYDFKVAYNVQYSTRNIFLILCLSITYLRLHDIKC